MNGNKQKKTHSAFKTNPYKDLLKHKLWIKLMINYNDEQIEKEEIEKQQLIEREKEMKKEKKSVGKFFEQVRNGIIIKTKQINIIHIYFEITRR